MKNQPNYFAIIPAEVRYADIPANAKLLYGEITALTYKEGFSWASSQYFAKLFGVSSRSIQDWLRKLEKAGFIKRKNKYSKDGKTIEKRCIYLVKKSSWGGEENFTGGGEENFRENSTSINNTSNITKVMGNSPQYGNADINLIMETFEKSFGLKPTKAQANRKAAQRLKTKLKDTDKVCRIIQYAASIQGDRYSPTVGSVLDIEEKLLKIIAHSKQQTKEVYDAR